jgi:DNA-binding NarL/FixJ family response regulator
MVVDDEPLVCNAVAMLLGREPNLAVCGEAESETQALERLRTTKADLALIDLSLKEGTGLRLIKRLRRSRPKLRMLVMSMFGCSAYVNEAFAAGAHGYVAKDEAAEKLLEAIALVMSGKSYVSDEMAARMASDLPTFRQAA